MSQIKPSSREAEFAYRRVWEINELLIPKPSDFVSAARFFIREGDLFLWDAKLSKKILYTIFLFNDILLITTRKKKKFRLRVFVTLRTPSCNVEIVDSSGHNYEFRLHCKTKSFYFYCDSDQDRKKWIKDINQSIAGNHQEEMDTRKIHAEAHEYTIKEMKDYSSSSGDDSSDELTTAPSKPHVSPPRSNSTALTAPRLSSQSGVKQSSIVYSDPTATNPFVSTNATSPFAPKSGSSMTKSNPGVFSFFSEKQRNKSVSSGTAHTQPVQSTGNSLFDSLLNTSVPFTPTVSANQSNNNFGFATFQSSGGSASNPSPFMTNSPFTQPTAQPALFNASPFGAPQSPSPVTSNPFATTISSVPFNTSAGNPSASPFGSPNPQPQMLFPLSPRTENPNAMSVNFGTTSPFANSFGPTANFSCASSNPFATNVTASPFGAQPANSNPFATNINASPFGATTAPSSNPFATNISSSAGTSANPFF